MKLSISGKKEDVLFAVDSLLSSRKDCQWIMITLPATSEGFSVQIVTDTSLDVIAKIKDSAF